ncbi:hypothetical protein [Paenibacillus tundrae]|nr:hypothetical protein [Paenibacillus tundrae]
MKLKGTATEEAYRAELQRTYDYIFNTEDGRILHQTIMEKVEDFQTAYIIDWIPDQGGDFFKLIVNGEMLVLIEIEEEIDFLTKDIIKKVISYESQSIKTYKKELSKTNQIKLEVAIDLCQTDMNKS